MLVQFMSNTLIKCDLKLNRIILIMSKTKSIVCKQKSICSSSVAVVNLIPNVIISFKLCSENKIIVWIIPFPPRKWFLLFVLFYLFCFLFWKYFFVFNNRGCLRINLCWYFTTLSVYYTQIFLRLFLNFSYFWFNIILWKICRLIYWLYFWKIRIIHNFSYRIFCFYLIAWIFWIL